MKWVDQLANAESDETSMVATRRPRKSPVTDELHDSAVRGPVGAADDPSPESVELKAVVEQLSKLLVNA